MKKYHFKEGDPVIVTTNHFARQIDKTPAKSIALIISVQGLISKVEPHKTLSTMYRINDNNGVSIGRFYYHQLKLNKSAIRDYKLKQLGI